MGGRGPLPDQSRGKRATGHRPVKSLTVAEGGSAQLSEAPAAPAALPEGFAPIWDAVVADMGGRRQLRPVDLPQVYAYAEAVWLHAEASKELHTSGLFVEGPAGRDVLNPAIHAQAKAAATMLRFAAELGLTPAARIRLAVEEITGMSILAGLNASLDAAG